MIDPFKLKIWTDPREREELAVFAVCVAGKGAAQQLPKVRQLLTSPANTPPFWRIKWFLARHQLENALRRLRMGQYKRIAKALTGLCKLDMDAVTLEQLEAVHGIGPKTARFILLYSRPGVRVAVLDTHILAWLRDQGYDAPKTTPTGKRYRDLEEVFLRECGQRGMLPYELDMEIWLARARAPRKDNNAKPDEGPDPRRHRGSPDGLRAGATVVSCGARRLLSQPKRIRAAKSARRSA